MDGVILFVDDKVHGCDVKDNKLERTPENQLFEALRKYYPVLGVKDLELAQHAIKSIGSFTAIILDWAFNDKGALLDAEEDIEDLKYVRDGEARTLQFLLENDFYSLVYIYSNEEVEEKYGQRLRERFGERIQIQKKPLEHPAEEITKRIEEWGEQNKNLSIPLAWTATINHALQQIFKELADADPNWVKEIGNSAQEDGVSGEVFIIEILQYLLVESLTQNSSLLTSIKDCLNAPKAEGAANDESQKEQSVAKLFRRLFYTRIDEDAPLMTGDVCQIDDTQYGIIITPECDVKDVISGEIASFELLTFSNVSFDTYLETQKYQRTSYGEASVRLLTKLRKIFNQDEGRYHVLPSFPFDETPLNVSIMMDFSKGCERYTIQEVKSKRKYKLNSPFIQQLRQRYISYLGRVGVPSLPLGLRNFNLK